MAVESYCPVLIVKDPHKRSERPDGYRFGACIDGSQLSLDALKLI